MKYRVMEGKEDVKNYQSCVTGVICRATHEVIEAPVLVTKGALKGGEAFS